MNRMEVEQKQPETTFETIAPSKLLNYVKKADLIAFITPPRYATMENELKQELGVSKINLKQMKQKLSTSEQFISALKSNQLG